MYLNNERTKTINLVPVSQFNRVLRFSVKRLTPLSNHPNNHKFRGGLIFYSPFIGFLSGLVRPLLSLSLYQFPHLVQFRFLLPRGRRRRRAPLK